MKALIKIGGSLLDDPASRHDIARQIADVARSGVAVTVVHGGGKQMTRFLDERGIQSRFIGGLRVTTEETIDAVLKVLAGSVNTQLTAALCSAGAKAVGLT
ncbi:MAG: acetylglutamate kinase, partial [Acidobacteriota bacterium]|nr:acetylglutamate kinase [Acidobacteriota bacterium]